MKYLSKSKYMAGLSCHRKLWLQLWEPQLAREADGMGQLIMEQGVAFGLMAHQLYPNATLIHVERSKLAEAEAATLSTINEGADTVLEATFSHNKLRGLADVFARLEDDTWHLIEVKSSTRTKPEHIPDLAYQKYVIEQCGYPVSKCSVLHANTNGNADSIQSMFTLVDVTQDVAQLSNNTAEQIVVQRPLLEPGSVIPDIIFDKVCLGCEFKKSCWKDIQELTIYETIDARKIYQLEALGTFYAKDIPDDFELSKNVRTMVDRIAEKRIDIDKEAISRQLQALEYPLYHLDFESISIATPLFSDSSPWQKYAFQYSLHVEQLNGDVEHFFYLHQQDSDPSQAIAAALLEYIGDTGSIIVYSKTMEKGVLKDLAAQFPESASRFKDMIGRIWDLEVIFRKHYRHWSWGTKSSIKKVLPTLVPDQSYDELDIQEGGMASLQWLRMVKATDTAVKNEIAASLLAYCRLDTLAMVEILKVVKAMY